MESTVITASASSFNFFCPTSRRPACPTLSLVTSPRRLASVCSAQCSSQRRPAVWPAIIFDSTLYRLRAGGSRMTDAYKLEHTLKLARIGIDIIEAGNPAESKDEFDSVQLIAEGVGNLLQITNDKHDYFPVICARAGLSEEHIKASWEAVRFAKQPRLNLFFVKGSLLDNTSPEQMAFNLVHYAKNTLGCPDVQLSMEYHERDSKIIYKMAEEAIRAGATTLSIHGKATPDLGRHFLKLLGEIKGLIPEGKDVVLSCGCYKDSIGSGARLLAEAVKLGAARQVETTLNGVGEVVSLEEFEDAIAKGSRWF